MIDRTRDVDDLDLVSASSVFNGFRLSIRIMPAFRATQGGDWCETFPLSDNIVALSIGDVCGHGPDASGTMQTMRRAVRDAASKGLHPGQTLANVNRTLCREQPGMYVTAIFGLLDTQRNTLSFANAGHPPPLMVGDFGERYLESGDGDLLLGMDSAIVPAVRVLKVPPETLLVFYTDGVIYHQQDAIVGLKQLLDAAIFAHHYAALSAAPVIERQMFLTGPNDDDAAILTARAPTLRMRTAL